MFYNVTTSRYWQSLVSLLQFLSSLLCIAVSGVNPNSETSSGRPRVWTQFPSSVSSRMLRHVGNLGNGTMTKNGNDYEKEYEAFWVESSPIWRIFLKPTTVRYVPKLYLTTAIASYNIESGIISSRSEWNHKVLDNDDKK